MGLSGRVPARPADNQSYVSLEVPLLGSPFGLAFERPVVSADWSFCFPALQYAANAQNFMRRDSARLTDADAVDRSITDHLPYRVVVHL
jgi:hypothetical protein